MALRRAKYLKQRSEVLERRRAEYRHNDELRAKIKTKSQRYYKNNKDKIRKQVAERYRSNEDVRQQRLDYEKVRAQKPEVQLRRRQRAGMVFEQGVSVEALREKQKNKCGICPRDLSARLHVDHDHTTGVVRGLLCSKCNMGIGMLQDSLQIVGAAFSYLAQPPAQELTHASR